MTDFYREAGRHTATVVGALGPLGGGFVPWWKAADGGELGRQVTVGEVLVAVFGETAGHAGIICESLDGAVGVSPLLSNLPPDYDWAAHVARVEQAARAAE